MGNPFMRSLFCQACGRPGPHLALLLIFHLQIAVAGSASSAEIRRSFALPGGDAAKQLEAFSEQADVSIIFPLEDVHGVRTNPVYGRLAQRVALDRLLADTGLRADSDGQTGSFVIRRIPPDDRDRPINSNPNHTSTDPTTTMRAESKRIKMAPLIALGLGLTVSSAGNAQSDRRPAEDEDSVYRLSPFEVGTSRLDDASTVVSATRFETPNRNLPVVVDVITEQTLNDWQYNDLMEALEALTPGIGPAGAPRQAIVRGMPSDYAMRNGVPVTNFFGTAPLSRIEVVRGATGVLFGMTQPGGVRNMISKRPTDKPAYDVSVTVDTINGNRSTFGASGPLTKGGALGYRFGAVYSELGDKYQLDGRYRYDRLLYPALQWRPTRTTQVFLEFDNVYYNASSSNISPNVRKTGENFNRPPTPNNLGYELSPQFDAGGPSPYQNQRVRLWDLVIDQGLGEKWDFRGMYSWQLYDQTNYQRQQNGQMKPNDVTINVTHRSQQNRFRQEFARLDLLGKFEWPGITHKMLIGGDYVWRLSTDQKIWNDATQKANGTYASNVKQLRIADYQNKTYENNWLYDFTDFRDRMPLQTVNRGWVEDFGTYVVNQVEFKRYHTHLLAGIRHDHMIEGASTPVQNYIVDPNGRTEPETVTDHISPQLGVVYQFNRALSAYVNYSTSAYPNRLINPDGKSLDAETGKGYDAGIKFGFFDNRLTGMVNLFDMYRQNLPIPDPAAETDPSRKGYYILVGEAESRGYEVSLNYRPNHNLTITGSYAYADAFDVQSRVPLARAFKHSGLFMLSYRVSDGLLNGLSTGLAINARSKVYFGQNGRTYAPSADSVSFRMSYPIRLVGRRIDLQMNVRNVIEDVEISDDLGGGWGWDGKRVFLFTASHKF